jgi:pimeloyl-ACP methyl ester carboxylesterase
MIDPRSPAIVLLHGAGATHGAWDSVADGLIEFSVSSIDLPGHVAGNGPSHRTVTGYAAAIEHDLPDAPLVLVGHSMGGLIACELGARLDNIVGIVTIGTGRSWR